MTPSNASLDHPFPFTPDVFVRKQLELELMIKWSGRRELTSLTSDTVWGRVSIWIAAPRPPSLLQIWLGTLTRNRYIKCFTIKIFARIEMYVFSLSGFPRSAHQIPDHQHDSGEGGDPSHCGPGTQTQSHEVRAKLLEQPLFSRNQQPLSKHLICLDRISGTGRLWR